MSHQARLNSLLNVLSLKIDYPRCRLPVPSHFEFQNKTAMTTILANALRYIEILKDGYFVSNNYNLPYHALARRLKQVMGQLVGRDTDVLQDHHWNPREKYLLIKSVMEYIDLLVKKDLVRKTDSQVRKAVAGSRTAVLPTTNDKEAGKEAKGGGNNLQQQDARVLALPVREKQKRNAAEEERCVDRALTKMEEWADNWLGRRLGGDDDWMSFENCLERPDT